MSQYDMVAQFYDLDQGRENTDETLLVIQMVQSDDDKILELGSGTGRVTIPLAKRRLKVYALDIEYKMLHIGQEKYNKLVETSGNQLGDIKWLCMDARHIGLNGTFDIVLALNNFLFEVHPSQLLKVLLEIYRTMGNKGRLVIEVFNPITAHLEQLNGWKRIIGEYEQKGKTIRISGSTKVDFLDQTMHLDLFYRLWDPKSLEPPVEITGTVIQYYLFYGQIINFLHAAHFDIDTIYGDYFLSPFISSISKKAIFICRKS